MKKANKLNSRNGCFWGGEIVIQVNPPSDLVVSIAKCEVGGISVLLTNRNSVGLSEFSVEEQYSCLFNFREKQIQTLRAMRFRLRKDQVRL